MIIDFRARPNTREYMDVGPGPDSQLKWRRWGYSEPPAVELSEFVSTMDQAGVSLGVFTGRRIITEGKVFGFTNDYVASCAAAFPDRIMGFTGLDIAAGAAEVAELDRTVRDFGFRGVSLDPRLSATHLDSHEAYPIYERAAELDIPVVFTMGPWVGPYSDPYRVDKVALQFPNLSIVCSHAPWPHVNEYLALAYRRPNVYLEPSLYWSLPGNDALFDAANGILSEQVIYASGHPFNSLDVVSKFEKHIAWDPENWERVSWRNAARLLKLDQHDA